MARYCEYGCGCRYGTEDPDARECACDGPCTMADHESWHPDEYNTHDDHMIPVPTTGDARLRL